MRERAVNKAFIRIWGRFGLQALGLWLLLLAVGLPLYLSSGPAAGPDEAAWGSESLRARPEGIGRFLPVPLANACGLGASSCFRCHNGKRAPSPTADAVTAPWHANHAKVNYSCAGCHQGNPRILKQEIAHKGLLADPRTEPAKACGGCHAAADVGSLVSRYQTPHPNTNTGK